jgi:glycosyltransferase involved in cell wall biosynthesis
MKTIIHVSSSLGGGGAEQMVFQLAKESNKDYKTIVFSLSHVDTLIDKFNAHNIEVHFLNINSFKNKTLIKGLKQLNEVIKNYDDIVFHSHQFHSGLLAVFYNFMYKKHPIVFTLHTNNVSSYSRRMLLFLTKPFRKKDIIFSKNSKKWYLKNSDVIPNGINFNDFANNQKREFKKSNTFSFLFLGRLETPKNPLFLSELVERIKALGYSNFEINVVGDGKLKEELLKEIKEKKIESYFNFLGFQSNIIPFLNQSHCLILPSLWEGLPIVIIEAAANKLPIISTPVGSIPDFLNNSNSTLSEIEHFHKAMITTIENYDNAIIKSENLYNDMKSIFNIQSVYLKHLELYLSIS